MTSPDMSSSQADLERIFPGGGELGARMRAKDWSQTPLGPPEAWPPSLRTAVSVMLVSPFPTLLMWGPEYVQIYNDSFRLLLGEKHPEALGLPIRQTFAEVWEVIREMFEGVKRTGKASYSENQLFLLLRQGFLEESYFTFSYVPARDEHGEIVGLIDFASETTGQVLGERRFKALRELAIRAAAAVDAEGVFRAAEEVLAHNGADVPFALLYVQEEDTHRLVMRTGLTEGDTGAPSRVPREDLSGWPLAEVLRAGEERLVEDVDTRLGALHAGPWPDPVRRALLTPLALGGSGENDAVLVVGLSPRLPFDEAYRDFLGLMSREVAADVLRARALEQEKQRAAKLAELDRQKTAFFGNVSHEFRTPLTLILGPTEDALSSPAQALQGEQLERVHGNAQRLLKLVNTLLEFSRVEAGKSRATFVPTDLAALTTGLASAFESVVVKAGLRLVVDCPPLPEPVWVDPGLWEKVVLNLVSNAFKFTLAGQVAVRQRWTGNGVELAVEDTGTGIPPEELPRLFQRFHRVEGAQGRSHEGSGIGLSLVQELVRLHGGEVRVESAPGVGSTFTVVVPAGRAHLPAEGVQATARPALPSASTEAFVREAAHWVPGSQEGEDGARQGEGGAGDAGAAGDVRAMPSAPGEAAGQEPRTRVLLADDNADMRAYVQSVLDTHFEVEAVADGEEALAAARARLPDVVLSDVMMPRMDGVALTRALREDPRTARVPVVLLSARAGEEATVDGLAAGADDYLIKPFGARELTARLQGAVKVARADAARRRALERVAEVLEAMGDAFFAMDADFRVTAVNPSYERMTGMRREDVLGKVFWDVFPDAGDPRSVYWQQYHRCMEARESVKFIDYYAPLSMWADLRANPTPDGGIAVFCRDISAEKEAEAIRARQAEFEKQLIGIVSHDLRNPLSAIQMGTTLLARREELSDRALKTVVRVQNSASRATDLVNDLLDFTQSRLGGGIAIQPVATDVHAVTHAVLVEMEVTHPEREVRFSHAGDGKADTDPHRVAQVVQNLVSNALKYSQEGTPVTVTSRGEAESIVISVHNLGNPIPEALQPTLFEPFKRGESHKEITNRSVGLGLYIVKQVVEAHRGSIEVTSSEARGTTFTMRLPRARG
ncbi:ATP-binding protein [Chondromyces apiculatus]|uniref:histidine kinase n=1 Tax=Chondromyces apiculatus DSM 436 TaxID=1192034 RepID=A0A017SZ11_9BACT|nr:ATP-binding protein [Chondromyces apiculatus]EYF01850.1 multi-sensor signal transduction histidine kinase [Chondromyces apiculatus DSM 436]